MPKHALHSSLLCIAVLTVAVAVPGAVCAQTVYSAGEGEGDAFAIAADEGGAYLGVRLVEETEHAEGGARVTRVVDGSPADEAGLREDDIVVEFDGEIIRGPVALTKRIHASEPGDRSTVKVIRDGRKQSFEDELGERSVAYAFPPGVSWDSDRWKDWQHEFKERMEGLGERLGNSQSYSFAIPEGSGSFSVPFVSWGRPKLGVELVETTPELRRHMGGNDEEGVLVSKVLEGTPAARSGIRVGDLILSVEGESVATVGELREALDDKEGDTFPLQVVREGRSMTIDVTIPEPDTERPTGPRAGLLTPPPAPSAPPAPVLAPIPAPTAVAAPQPPASRAVPVLAPAPPPPPAPTPPLAPAPPASSVGILV